MKNKTKQVINNVHYYHVFSLKQKFSKISLYSLINLANLNQITLTLFVAERLIKV